MVRSARARCMARSRLARLYRAPRQGRNRRPDPLQQHRGDRRLSADDLGRSAMARIQHEPEPDRAHARRDDDRLVGDRRGQAVKTYTGKRDKTGTCHVWIIERGESRLLPPRLELANHSPTGFEWGYGGSGPAQLALAMVADGL